MKLVKEKDGLYYIVQKGKKKINVGRSRVYAEKLLKEKSAGS